MKRYALKCALAMSILFMSVQGCIVNDIPYPYKLGAITAFEVAGQLSDAVIDNDSLTVTVDLIDSVDLTRVRVLRFETTDSTMVLPDISSYIDLTTPVGYELTTYPRQTYSWTIRGNQTIERYVKVENQVDEAIFNVDEHQVLVYVSMEQPLDDITVKDVKLGPVGSVITPDPREIHDYTKVQAFTVEFKGQVTVWSMAIFQKEAMTTTNEADAWAYFANLSGKYNTSLGAPSFKYKKTTDSEWTEVSGDAVNIKDGNVTATVKNLTPDTDYVYKIVAGDREGDEISFRTEKDLQMPNMGFDQWVKEGKSWCPNPDMGSGHWWDSGNEGANVIGEANPTSPEENFLAPGANGDGKKAARLETIAILGIMAGGNVFSGDFVKIEGTAGASVDFGRPWNTRPLQLKGYYYYAPKTIDKAKTPYEGLMGRPDRCHIFVYLTDSDEPAHVNTAKKVYLTQTDPSVIAYGELIDSVGTDGSYKQFSINFKYRDTRKPKHCIVVAVASQYADYFTGGVGSLMFVDEFSFNYKGDVVWDEKYVIQ